MKPWCCLLALAAACHGALDLRGARWPSHWITAPGIPARAWSVVHFRKSIHLAAVPERLPVAVSADNRYRLFVNGRFVAAGPPHSDLRNWRYDTVDLAPHLRAGRNVLAAEVWNAGEFKPMAQISDRTGFVMQALADYAEWVNTGASWTTFVDTAYQPIAWAQVDRRLLYQYYVAGTTERFDATLYAWDWQQPDYDDSGWRSAEELPVAVPVGVEGHVRWQLTPTDIPQLEERPRTSLRIVKGGAAFPVSVAAHSQTTLLLDEGELTTGYPSLTFAGGRGAEIKLTYSEAMYGEGRIKGRRSEVAGKHVIGVHDLIAPDGNRRTWRPLGVRSWRFVEVAVLTTSEPLTLAGWQTLEIGYPAALRASFTCDREDIDRLWRIGWRTLQLGAQDTFVSDLAWERIQYVGDTRLQGLAWLAATGDEKLLRQALQQFDASRAPFGLTQSRFPADLEQYTPLYSLVWINMLHDWWMYRGEAAFVKQFLPGVRDVLGWYERQQTSDGLIPPLFHLDFVDSDYFSQYEQIVRDEHRPAMAIHSLLYAYALDDAAELFDGLGAPDDARRARETSARVKARARQVFWDPARGLFADSPSHRFWSQQANVLAVLSGAAPGGADTGILERVLTDTSLAQSQLYFRFYLGRALRKAGLGDKYIGQLGPWLAMAQQGMTTFGEQAGNPRSECHPWSATPVYEFLSTVAGIEPATPGFTKVRIAPSLANLGRVAASMPHPRGMIAVECRRTAGGGVRATVSLPAGLAGEFVWRGRVIPISGTLNFEVPETR